jgi:HEAT repeat protein
MKPALCLMAATLALGAQPKLLVNATVDTRSGAALDREFKTLLAAQPQPAWIMYDVPAVRNPSLSCEYVRDGYSSPGVIHLEPPGHAVILFRVEANAVTRIRSLSPDCEIDAGGLPVHWLTDVAPAQSVALLASYVPRRELDGDGPGTAAVAAIGAHADPSADAALDRLLAPTQPEWLRRSTASLVASQRGRPGVEAVKNLIANDSSDNVRQAAINGLARNKEPEAVDLLIATARADRNPRIRAQAISALNRKPGQPALDAIQFAIANDTDATVRRRAVDALGSLPDGAGIPMLIQLVKTSKDPEVRKQAMNKLEASHDARAQAFFEEVLK